MDHPMPPPRKISLASRLTAGCITLVVVLAGIAAGVGWWWKFRAMARENALRSPAAVSSPAAAAPSGPINPTAPGR